MLQTNANFADKLKRGTWPMPHVTVPMRQIDTKEKRRKRIAALSEIANAIYGEAFARLAK
ncbi:MAG TPA: hypothetical protein VIF61_12390 [Methylocystis sp.]